MDYKHITQLLKKYFEGETSLQEEAQLKAFFQKEEVPEQLRQYQSLFQFFEAEKTIFLDKPIRVLSNSNGKIRKLLPLVRKIAAVVLVAIGVWWMYPESPVNEETAAIDWSKYEAKTPEEAFKITHSTLKKVSVSLNKGAKTAVKEISKVQKATKIFK